MHISEEHQWGWTLNMPPENRQYLVVYPIHYQILNVCKFKTSQNQMQTVDLNDGIDPIQRALVRSFLHRTESGHAIVSSALLTRNILQCCNIDFCGKIFVNIGQNIS